MCRSLVASGASPRRRAWMICHELPFGGELIKHVGRYSGATVRHR
jgi:hypothetical protein